MSDDRIRDQVRLALIQEPVYTRYDLRLIDHTGQVEVLRGDLAERDGDILFSVEDGVVTLQGHVGSHSHRRLASLVSWWVPGSRNVVNGLIVEPPEEDNDGELADGVDLALEKDSLLRGDLIQVQVNDGVVTLGGSVRTEQERIIAEHDAWYVEGVQEVMNRITAP
jgi:osmotically-inducible protein OsmY